MNQHDNVYGQLFSLCCSGVLRMSRQWERVTVKEWTTCWGGQTLSCWRSTWPLKPRASSAAESWPSWNPQQHWSTSAEVGIMCFLELTPVTVVNCYSKTQIFSLILLFPCLRSCGGPGCFSQSSSVWNDSSCRIRRDSSWTFTKVSSLWKKPTLFNTQHNIVTTENTTDAQSIQRWHQCKRTEYCFKRKEKISIFYWFIMWNYVVFNVGWKPMFYYVFLLHI